MSTKSEGYDSDAFTLAPEKSALSAEAAGSISISLLHVHPTLGDTAQRYRKAVSPSPRSSLPSTAMGCERVGTSPSS